MPILPPLSPDELDATATVAVSPATACDDTGTEHAHCQQPRESCAHVRVNAELHEHTGIGPHAPYVLGAAVVVAAAVAARAVVATVVVGTGVVMAWQ